jgi:anti-anti-sigma factor
MSALLVRPCPTQNPPTLVMIAGEIDIASAPALRRHLLALPGCDTVLELSGLRLLSAAGLTEFIDLRDRLSRTNAALALVAPQRLVRRVLAITGVDDTIMLVDTIDAAIREVATRKPSTLPVIRRGSEQEYGHGS